MNIFEIIYRVVMYLTCVFEIYILYDLLVGRFEIYDNRKAVLFIEMVATGIVISLINKLNQPTLNLIFVPIIMFLFIWLVFRIDMKQNLLFLIFYSVLLAISEFAFYHIYILTGNNGNSVDVGKALFTMIKVVFMFAVVKVIKKKIKILMKNVFMATPKVFLFSL